MIKPPSFGISIYWPNQGSGILMARWPRMRLGSHPDLLELGCSDSDEGLFCGFLANQLVMGRGQHGLKSPRPSFKSP